MPLVPNYPAGHEKVGQSKTRDDYSPGEVASHIRGVVEEARENVHRFLPVDRAAIEKAAKMAAKLKDEDLINTVASIQGYVDSMEVRRGAGGAGAAVKV